MSDLTLSSSITMTSKEIAELTGKEHKNVLRDIDNLLKTLGSDLSLGFSMTYEGDPAHGYRIFHLDRDSTFCLMAGYDAVARMKIIKRWQALESGEATPAFRLKPQTPPSAPLPGPARLFSWGRRTSPPIRAAKPTRRPSLGK